MLRITQQIIDDLFEHAKTGLPEEVCGYLAGTGSEVTRQFRLTNIYHSNEHFSFDPKEQFQVVREARKAGLEILPITTVIPKPRPDLRRKISGLLTISTSAM